MSDAKREGPALTILASCQGCAHEANVRYSVQGDSGCDVMCTHPNAPDDSEIGDTTWRTPDWCPLRVVALERLLANMTAPPTIPADADNPAR